MLLPDDANQCANRVSASVSLFIHRGQRGKVLECERVQYHTA
jgi:hypothetical protein